MTDLRLKPCTEVVAVHSDVLSEDFSEDMFALDLGPLADGNPHVPACTAAGAFFFRASYLTSGLKKLLLADVRAWRAARQTAF